MAIDDTEPAQGTPGREWPRPVRVNGDSLSERLAMLARFVLHGLLRH